LSEYIFQKKSDLFKPELTFRNTLDQMTLYTLSAGFKGSGSMSIYLIKTIIPKISLPLTDRKYFGIIELPGSGMSI
jgi:hypothetical protein